MLDSMISCIMNFSREGTMDQRSTLRFVGGAAEAEDLEAEITSVLLDLADPNSEATGLARAAGLNPDDLAGAEARVTKEAKGFGPVVILVAIAVPVASHIINQFWDDVIWPRIKGTLGADAIGKSDEGKPDE
jgi:hypothetical protein